MEKSQHAEKKKRLGRTKGCNVKKSTCRKKKDYLKLRGAMEKSQHAKKERLNRTKGCNGKKSRV